VTQVRRFGAGQAVVAVALFGCVGGCMVPAAQYERSQSSLRVEQTAHRQTLGQLHMAQQELSRAQAQLAQTEGHVRRTEARLADMERAVAQTRLDASLAAKEREEAVELVEQLRGELARVGEHLRSFALDKTELGEALAQAETRVARLVEIEQSAAFRALVAHDLTLALYEPLATGEYELAVDEDHVVLRVPAARVFASPDGELQPETSRLFAAVAAVATRHAAACVRVTETGGALLSQQQSRVRLMRVSSGLIQQGLTDSSVTITLPEQSPAAVQAAGTLSQPAAGSAAEAGPASIQFAISAV
jgi:hypothetical protein